MAKKKPKAESEAAPAKMGRPTVFTEEKRRIFCAAIRRGMPMRLACDLIEVAYGVVKATQRRDPDFKTQVNKAKGERVLKWLECFQRAVEKGEWRAAQYLLKVTHPEHFVERDPDSISDAQLAGFMQAFAEKMKHAIPAKYHKNLADGIAELIASLMGKPGKDGRMRRPRDDDEAAQKE